MVVAATEDVGAVLVVFALNPTIEVIPEKIEFLDLFTQQQMLLKSKKWNPDNLISECEEFCSPAVYWFNSQKQLSSSFRS